MGGTLFISDLHLSAERPAANQLFHRFVDEVAVRAAALFILGDLFEYWIGDDELSAADGDPLGRDVAQALRRLTQAGVRVHLMHGNRDFLLGRAFLAASGAQELADPTTVELSGVATLLMHGDTLCTDDVDYQAWRRTARSAAWQQDFLAQPLAVRRAAILQLREQSQRAMLAKPSEIMDVNVQAVRDALREHRVRRLIHGHTHRSARHEAELDGHACERWVLPDWYRRGGYLSVDEFGPRLVSL